MRHLVPGGLGARRRRTTVPVGGDALVPGVASHPYVPTYVGVPGPAPDLRLALVPSPAPVVTAEVLPPSTHPSLAQRLAAESSTLVLAGVLLIEWGAGIIR